MKIIPIYINQQSNINNQRFYQKNPINSVSQDDFTGITRKMQQQKFNPSFRSVSDHGIIKLCNNVIRDIAPLENPLTSIKEIKAIATKFLSDLKGLTEPYRNENQFFFEAVLQNGSNTTNIQCYVLEMDKEAIFKNHSEITNDQDYLKYLKTIVINDVESVKEHLQGWVAFGNLHENPQKTTAEECFKIFGQVHKRSIKQFNISIEGMDFLNNTQIENPYKLIELFRQACILAGGICQKKSFKIMIDKNKKSASVIIPGVKLSNDEINKIQKKKPFNIDPFNVIDSSRLIELLPKNDYRKSIQNLIQNTPEGVCLLLPLTL